MSNEIKLEMTCTACPEQYDAYLVACCGQPPAPIERFGLKLTVEDFAELGESLDRITAAEQEQP